VLVVAGSAMVLTEYATTRRAMIQDMTALADLLARNSTAPLSFHREEDAEELNKMLSALAADPHIMLATLYDRDQHRFGEYRRDPNVGQIPATPPTLGRRFLTDYAEVCLPVELQGTRIGTIYLRGDLARMYGQLMLYAAIVGLILLVVTIITLAVAPRLRKPIAEPILALAALARRVAARKDYSARAVTRGRDEVGLLTDAFNQMLDEIQTTHDKLAVAKDVAEAASRAKDQFLAVLSHELRTPLTPVLLMISLLQHRPGLSDEMKEDIATIRRHVELEARLIDDLLDLTRIARGKLQLTFETADAHAVLKDAVSICCGQRMQDVDLSLQASEHHVRADPGRFLQVFWNLLNNAQKFTPAGKRIAVRTSNPRPGTLRIEVCDEGIGIEPQALPKIFKAFEQGDTQSARPSGGLGLGLAIAQALVEAHGGTVAAASAGKDQGASFTVEMPTVAAPALRPAGAPAPRPPLQVRAETKPLRLLLVEDHESTLRLMTRLLTGAGHAVSGATSVRSALDIAQRENIDLVISDLGLPDGTGLELMRQLRDRHGLRGICLTGYGMEEDLARSAEAGFIEHLTKPVDIGRLQKAIDAAVAQTL
jgi:two-component system CheB/CheR fusion protein